MGWVELPSAVPPSPYGRGQFQVPDPSRYHDQPQRGLTRSNAGRYVVQGAATKLMGQKSFRVSQRQRNGSYYPVRWARHGLNFMTPSYYIKRR